jgi:hypothetical protein
MVLREVAVLRRPNGVLEQDPRRITQLVAQHWAGVSSAPPIHQVAEQQVLAAVQAVGVTVADPDFLGNLAVTEEEVGVALSAMKPGRAPGLDGIPVEFYRRYKAELVPVFAALFSAIGSMGKVPQCFLDGLLVILHKKGDRSDANNYRPITLLGTDYRLLAKVLGNRLRDALGSIIGNEQTAFLPGREIGENVLLLQLLDDLLQVRRESAVVAFLDFCKAYDTISRPFLLHVMETMGVGPGFLQWTRLLLTDTKAVAKVNGWVSTRVCFKAGVRQGCPLAPLLYLFIAHALLAWLKTHGPQAGMGVEVDGKHLVATQFADDTEAILSTLASWPHFAALMHTFGQASGQHLNWSKVVLLQIGCELPSPPLLHPANPPHPHLLTHQTLPHTPPHLLPLSSPLPPPLSFTPFPPPHLP